MCVCVCVSLCCFFLLFFVSFLLRGRVRLIGFVGVVAFFVVRFLILFVLGGGGVGDVFLSICRLNMEECASGTQGLAQHLVSVKYDVEERAQGTLVRHPSRPASRRRKPLCLGFSWPSFPRNLFDLSCAC